MASLAVFTSSPIFAEMSELKVQDPWAYAFRIDRDNNIEYMATTPAVEDSKVWLVLACKDNQRIGVSIVNSGGFTYPLTETGQLIAQLDGADGVSLPSVVVQQKQIRADPVATKRLIPVLMRSSQLLLSTDDTNGVRHTYSFSLQPNNIALRDIDIHCLFE
jgi:hypothetical protein